MRLNALYSSEAGTFIHISWYYITEEKMYPVKCLQRMVTMSIWHKEIQNQSGMNVREYTQSHRVPL